MTTTTEVLEETSDVEPKGSPKPCLELSRGEDRTFNVLHYALVNSTISENPSNMQICATFPSRRAVFVVEEVGKSAGVVRYRNVEFYEFSPERGWMFKKLYRTSLV